MLTAISRYVAIFSIVFIFCVFSGSAFAKNCRKGIPCGATCIAAWKTCHIDVGSIPLPTEGLPTSKVSDSEKLEFDSLSNRGTGTDQAASLAADKKSLDINRSKVEALEISANIMESDYVKEFCGLWQGKIEVTLSDRTRIDCLTKDRAIEFDFAKKWAESIGQALHYGLMSGKQPAIALIVKSESDKRHAIKIKEIVRKYKLPIKLIEIWDLE